MKMAWALLWRLPGDGDVSRRIRLSTIARRNIENIQQNAVEVAKIENC